MEWILNDLSLNGQFLTEEDLKTSVQSLLLLRGKYQHFKDSFYISRTLGLKPALYSENLIEAIGGISDKNFKLLMYTWLSKGPFWDEDRFIVENDYFEYEGMDVTNHCLGEACRGKVLGNEISSVSFRGGEYNFEQTPLRVQHGLSEEVYNFYDICNFWEVTNLDLCICSSQPRITSWHDFLLRIQSDFAGELIIPDYACDKLKVTPFSMYVVKRSYELLNVLAQLVSERTSSGAWTSKGQDLYNDHFTGSKAWFTDESQNNKNHFEHEMSFIDPDDINAKITCSWHGKIKTPQTRIHFEWPIPKGKKLKVLFIGPKITKT